MRVAPSTSSRAVLTITSTQRLMTLNQIAARRKSTALCQLVTHAPQQAPWADCLKVTSFQPVSTKPVYAAA
jgi:hypothetical protein